MDNHSRQDLLEAVLMSSELGDISLEKIKLARAEDTHVEVTEAHIVELEKGGYLCVQGDEIGLTPTGREIAEKMVRRHRLTEMLLFSLLGVNRELASEIGCTIEHGVREEMIDGVCTLLGHPATCPHGRPIPPGPCCKEGRSTFESPVVPLSSLKAGQKARVVYIRPREHHRLHKLASMGLTPGAEIELHRRRPVFVLRFEQTELAIDANVAEDIHVSRLLK